MKWSTLYKLYNKFLGISIFILASISTITLTTDIAGISIEKYYSASLSILVFGAILLSTLYILFQISIPDEIIIFNKENYVDRYIKMNNNDIINIDYEFAVLDGNKNIAKFDKILLSKYKDKDYINPFDLNEIKKLLGNKAIVFLSELKYEYLNCKSKIIRWLLTIGFFVSLLLMYSSSIIRIYDFIKGGFNA
jgi:hypothetical protein